MEKPEKTEKIAAIYKDILAELVEDSTREGLLKTPERVAKSLQYLTRGYDQDPEEILKSALFQVFSTITSHLPMPCSQKLHVLSFSFLSEGSIRPMV